MFGGVTRTRLPRVASALAQRRNYVGVVLRGGDGTKPIALKLSPPWMKVTPQCKLFDAVATPILRVVSPSMSIKDDSRVTITLAEKSGVIASVQLLPKITEEESEDEDEEAMVDTSEEEDYYEEDEFSPAMEKSSGDELMNLFYMGGAAEPERGMEEEEDSIDSLPDRKCSGTKRPPSSFIIEFSLWPRDSFASATILRTDGKSDCIWQSSWSFNVNLDSINEDISHSHDGQGPIVVSSRYNDQQLQYTGVICGSILDKFRISFGTHYEVKELLGSGGEGHVYMCASLDNSHNCAIKWSSYKHIIIEEPREAVFLKKLLHPNIRRMFCAWVENREATDLFREHSVFLAQELCKCTLEDYLDEKTVKSISERVGIFAETVSGVSYLHSQGIVHRDIKCGNIFIDDHGNVKVGDFGQSGLLSSHSCSHGGKLYGTKLYGSPELLRKQKHGLKSDVFSLGMVYAELFGPSAIAAERREWLLKLRRLIQSPQWKKNPFSSWQKSELSKDWCGDVYLMMKMLESSPEERPSCAEILELL